MYQLTGDDKWDEGGKYWKCYDLGIEERERYVDDTMVLLDMETEIFGGVFGIGYEE